MTHHSKDHALCELHPSDVLPTTVSKTKPNLKVSFSSSQQAQRPTEHWFEQQEAKIQEASNSGKSANECKNLTSYVCMCVCVCTLFPWLNEGDGQVYSGGGGHGPRRCGEVVQFNHGHHQRPGRQQQPPNHQQTAGRCDGRHVWTQFQ